MQLDHIDILIFPFERLVWFIQFYCSSSVHSANNVAINATVLVAPFLSTGLSEIHVGQREIIRGEIRKRNRENVYNSNDHTGWTHAHYWERLVTMSFGVLSHNVEEVLSL